MIPSRNISDHTILQYDGLRAFPAITPEKAFFQIWGSYMKISTANYNSMPNIRKNLCVNSKNTFGDTEGQAEGWTERQTLSYRSLLPHQKVVKSIKKITTNLRNPCFISATFRRCFFCPFFSFNDDKIKVRVLQ